MEKYFEILKKNQLFKDINDKEILPMLSCLQASIETYEKDDYIMMEGEFVDSIRVVVSGAVNIIKEDYWGNRSILSQINIGELFGEAYALDKKTPLLISAIATKKTTIICLNIHRILNICTTTCNFHNTLIENLLRVFARKNLILTRKMEHLSKRTTREKLLSYLSNESFKNNSNKFTITFNRQELADFLAVDRSAMSTELTKLQKDGLIIVDKNTFTISKQGD